MVANHKIKFVYLLGQDGNGALENNVLDFSLQTWCDITEQIHQFTGSSHWEVMGQPSIPLHQTTYICFKQ